MIKNLRQYLYFKRLQTIRNTRETIRTIPQTASQGAILFRNATSILSVFIGYYFSFGFHAPQISMSGSYLAASDEEVGSDCDNLR